MAREGWVLDAGHEAGAEVAVLVADVDRLVPAAPHDTTLLSDTARPGDHQYARGVVLADRPDAAWWALALGRDPTPDERWVLDPAGHDEPGERIPSGLAAARAAAAPEVRTAFGTVPGTGVIRAAVVGDHLHLSRLAVRPEARRAGVGTTLTAAAAAWAREQGARWALLQVALHNTAARALYDALGATEQHRHRYLVPPARADPAPPSDQRPRGLPAAAMDQASPAFSAFFRPDHSPRYLPATRPLARATSSG